MPVGDLGLDADHSEAVDGIGVPLQLAVRASRLLAAADDGTAPTIWRALAWLAVSATAGVGLGLLALLIVGNAVVAAIGTGFWWTVPDSDPFRLVTGFALRSWPTALTLGPLQAVALTAVAAWGFPPTARTYARCCVAVLSPSSADRLADRVTVLTESRADVLDAHGAELRRIERDLHDGTQAALVAIAVRLGVAEQAHARGDHRLVGDLLRQAHEGTETAMTDLRSVLRSVYPPILADRGLAGALTALVAGCAVPTLLELDDLGRVPAAVEAVVYFVVAEALTNVVRHSGAGRVRVRVASEGGLLRASVTDDGAGAADPTAGSGLSGIRDRARALDGRFELSSPAGGPTTVTVELPCAW